MKRFFNPACLQLAVVLMFPVFMIATAQMANGDVVAERPPASDVAGREPLRSALPISHRAVLSAPNRVWTHQQ